MITQHRNKQYNILNARKSNSRTMAPKRISSKIKSKQIETKLLEQQTGKMEQKLEMLRQQVAEQKRMKQSNSTESTLSRWKKVTSRGPIRNYADKVLADRKAALNQFGIDEKKILGSKSFEPALSKIRSDKLQAEFKNPTKMNHLGFTAKQKPADSLPVQSISSNFFKAKMKSAELVHRKSLEEFLEENFVQEYLPVLTRNLIYQLDDLYHTNRQKMTEMGIKPGHQVKILKRIKEEMDGNPTHNDKTSKDQIPQKQQQKVSFGYGEGDVNDYAQITKNEQMHRKVDNTSQSPFHSNEEEEIQVSEEDAEEENDVVLFTNPMVEFQLQTADPQQSAQRQTFNCFQCYSRSQNDPQLSSDCRKFCCTQCLNSYLQFMQKTCPQCNSLFYKFDGHHENGLWFCSIACCPNREQIEEMFISWAKSK